MQRRALLGVLGTTTVAGLAGCSALTGADTRMDDGLVTVESDDSFEETLERIQDDIENSPLTLLTTIDHAENAASVDAELQPTTVLLFGNPEVGTPLMEETRTIGIDLPQKMLVWQDGDDVRVTYNDPEHLADRHGIDGQDDRIEQIATVLERIATGTDS